MNKIDNQLDRLEDALHAAAVDDLGAATAAEAQAPAPFWRRRAPRLALGGALALSALSTALIVGAGGGNAPSAYAVETPPGGGLKIEIFSLADPEGVERVLAEAGVASQVSYLEAGMTCREPHYQPSMAMLRTLQDNQPQPQPWAGFDYQSISGPLTIAIGDYQQRRQMDEEIREAWRQGDRSVATPDFVIDPTGFRPDQTLVMVSVPAPEGYQPPVYPTTSDRGEYIVSGHPKVDTLGEVRVAEGTVGPCEPVPATDDPPSVRAPEGGWDFSEVPYAGWGFGFGIENAK